jgi:hypothetical protein
MRRDRDISALSQWGSGDLRDLAEGVAYFRPSSSFEKHLRSLSDMVGRMKRRETGQTIDESSKTCPPKLVAHPPLTDSVKRWETKFDAALVRPETGTQLAWRKLIEKGCQPLALKSMLYYAAEGVELANEAMQTFDACDLARNRALKQTAQLKRILQELAAVALGGHKVATALLRLYHVEEQDISFFEVFPVLLEQFENILKRLTSVPGTGKGTTTWTIGTGEALVHIYVEEITGSLLSEETAVLLKASAVSYGLDGMPSYNTVAVKRRYLRFRKGKGFRKGKDSDDCKAMRRMVRLFRPSLDDFLVVRTIIGAIAAGLEFRAASGTTDRPHR